MMGADAPPDNTHELVRRAERLIELGEWDDAEGVLDQAYRLSAIAQDPRSRAAVTWSRAQVAAGRGDPVGAERLFREVERDAGAWWEDGGANLLAEAARTLDVLGLTPAASGYLRRAQAMARGATREPGQRSEEVTLVNLAQAVMLARTDEPGVALQALAALTTSADLPPRLRWRVTLIRAWALLRAGERERAGVEAAAALEQAAGRGGLRVAIAGEPDITAALAPLAADRGSASASGLLAGESTLVVWLFGTPKVVRRDGHEIELPTGQPAELVRMLALHPHGLPVEVVLEAFFPDAAPQPARHRLRQVLTRLRAAAGEIVVREEDMLRLVPAWVDVCEFIVLARRARASRGTRQLIFSAAAHALADRGPLLVGAPDAEWAHETRQAVADGLLTLRTVGADGP